MNRNYLQNILNDDDQFIEFCFNNGILKKKIICNVCCIDKILIKNNNKMDGFEWKCLSKKCKKSKNSIRKDSI